MLKTLGINYSHYAVMSLMSLKPLKFSHFMHTLYFSQQLTNMVLKKLIRSGYVLKTDKYYTLTISGRQYLADINKRLK